MSRLTWVQLILLLQPPKEMGLSVHYMLCRPCLFLYLTNQAVAVSKIIQNTPFRYTRWTCLNQKKGSDIQTLEARYSVSLIGGLQLAFVLLLFVLLAVYDWLKPMYMLEEYVVVCLYIKLDYMFLRTKL